MATRYNYTGKLVTDGLVLNLDAAKRDSYPGSGTTWYDLSGNGNNGTLTNGPTYTGVSKDAAIVFDGANDYVNCGNAGSLKIIGPITLNSFFNANAFNVDYQAIIAMGDNSYRLQRHYNTSKLAFGSRNIGLTDLTSSISVTTGSWYCATAVYDGSFMNLYINGAPNSKGAASGNLPASNYNLYVGSNQQFPTRRWNGSIAISQIYNRSLSQFEVFQNFNALKGRYGIPDIVTDGLVLNLDAGNPYSYLSGSSGTTWTDVSGQGNNGTLTNGASYENGAIVFDGVDDYVNLQTAGLLSGWSSFTYNVWVYVNTISTGYWVGWISANTSQTNYNISIGQWNNTQKLWIEVDTTTGNYYGGGPGVNTFPLNQWFNVTMTYDGSKVTSYINTVQDTQFSATGNLNTISKLVMGAPENNESNGFLNGRISTGQVYNRALSAAEITQNFNALRGRYGI